jgi:hypothetical protein
MQNVWSIRKLAAEKGLRVGSVIGRPTKARGVRVNLIDGKGAEVFNHSRLWKAAEYLEPLPEVPLAKRPRLVER